MLQNGGRLSLSATGVTEKLGIFVKREKTAAILVAMVLPLPSLTVIASERQGAAVPEPSRGVMMPRSRP
jgi:hypothetical protein